MAEKRRVYQVAKERKLSSDALISMLKGMGHDIKSHMSVVTDEMLKAISEKFEQEKQSSMAEVQRQKSKEEDLKKQVRPAEKRDTGGETKVRSPETRPQRRRVSPSVGGGGGGGGMVEIAVVSADVAGTYERGANAT